MDRMMKAEREKMKQAGIPIPHSSFLIHHSSFPPPAGAGWQDRSVRNGLRPSKPVYRLPFLPSITTCPFCEAYPAFVTRDIAGSDGYDDGSQESGIRSQETEVRDQ